jgi:hypothetical protein
VHEINNQITKNTKVCMYNMLHYALNE